MKPSTAVWILAINLIVLATFLAAVHTRNMKPVEENTQAYCASVIAWEHDKERGVWPIYRQGVAPRSEEERIECLYGGNND